MAKKTETKATVKQAAKAANYAEMDIQALQAALAEKRQDLIATKRSHRAGELVNPRVLGSTRKEIARIHTAITAAKAAEKESK